MGEEQRVSWQELLATSHAAFEDGTDLTLAVEEEFALLDPETLELTDRFEELYAAALETDLAPNIVGELIASEVEVRTGKCTDFGEAADAMRERREQLHAVASELKIGLGGTGTHPWSRWQDQRIIDTPHYRRNNELLRYVVWRNNTFGLHVHVGIGGADRAIAVHDALRNFLPELLALSASSPFVEDVDTGLHSARTEIFTRMFPRCGIPDAYGGWRGLGGLRLVPLPHRLDHRAHADLVERAPAPRLPDRRDPDLRRPARPRRGAVPRRALLRAGRALRARVRRGRAAARPAAPPARGEPVARDPLRPLRRAARLRARRADPRPGADRAAARVGRAGRDEIGAAPFLAMPGANAAERQIERVAEGADLRRDLRRAGAARASRSLADEVDPQALADELAAFDVDQFLVAAASTLASLAFAKLEGGDLGQARKAIDALAALLPHVESGAERRAGAGA